MNEFTPEEYYSRLEVQTFARPGYVANALNHQEDANYLPYETYNKIGKMAGQLYIQKPEKPSEQTPDQPKIPSDIIPRQNP